MPLDTIQKQAYTLATKNHENIFLTGDAGTGKSYLLNKIIKKLKDPIVIAPTGIAALNIGGSTIHSFLEISPKTDLFTPIVKSQKAILRNIAKNKQTIIIDEVSMMRIDLFEYLFKGLFELQSEGYNLPQIILTGDFYQLPPVVTSNDRKELAQHYPNLHSFYAFSSPYWNKLQLHSIVLKTVHRQHDDRQMQRALNAIRLQNESRFQAIDFINNESAKSISEGAITLCGTNKRAENINNAALQKLDAPLYTAQAFISDKFGRSLPEPEQLAFKEGARIMITKNGIYKEGDEKIKFYNGDMGTIVNIEITDDDTTITAPAQDAYDAMDYKDLLNNVRIWVKLDRTGQEIALTWNKWDKYEYKDKKGVRKKVAIGSFIQLPFKLAYAITVHKSQGQTFEKVAFLPEIFAPGQLYVGLSRVVSLKNLYLYRPLNAKMSLANPEVTEFYQSISPQTDAQGVYDKTLGSYLNKDRYEKLHFLANLDEEKFAKVSHAIGRYKLN